MARFDIISKDGSTIRFSGKPKYIGSYLKPSYIEFSEIASPSPIEWEVGDYVDYSRTGMRYRLYSIPQPSKNARKETHGRAFTYSNVQLHAATKELEIALFRDLVDSDNGVHFSTSPDVATFEDVYGIARRIQACMDDLYPNRWEIRVADFDEAEDVDIIENITEAKDFALSGGTCLDALSKIYELWQDIGWIHTYENGKEVITIGYANKRIDANTTDSYLYGKGNGLTAIKKNQTNKDEFATRLYVYGSERNLPARYYNGKNILNAESVDIRNLMLPLDSWGLTDGLPDARKAYLENAEAVAKFGVVPKIHYFDSDDAGANIYPSISGMTIGMVRKALADMNITKYSPSTVAYPDASERVDEVKSATNPADDGVLKKNGEQFEEVKEMDISGTGSFGIYSTTQSWEFTLVETSFAKSGKGEVSIAPDMSIIVIGENLQSVKIKFDLADQNSIKFRSVVDSKTVSGVQSATNSAAWSVKIPSLSIRKETATIFPVYLTIRVEITTEDTTERSITIRRPSSPLEVRYARVLEPTFGLVLKQVGFDIDKQASLGEGKVISMKTGACAGRNFEISACRYQSDSDTWAVDCKRQQDDTLGMLFPNADYPIVASDRFVLLEIAMPESYIRVAMERLLAEGQKLLTRASKVQNHYEPSVDAKVMAESGRTLREGMFMEISDADVVDGVTDYILIDTLSIYEDESAIPTYKVTLRERRKVTYKGTPSVTSATATKSVEDVTTDGESEVEVDLSNYYTKEEVNELIDEVNAGDIDLTGYYTKSEIEAKGYITLTALEGYATNDSVDEKIKNIDLSSYATKQMLQSTNTEVGVIAKRVKDIEDAGYATKEDVAEGIAGIDLTPYAKAKDIADTYATKAEVSSTYATKQMLQTTNLRVTELEAAAITINGAEVKLGGSFKTAEIAGGGVGSSLPTSGYTLYVPHFVVNEYGIVTSKGTHLHTINNIPNSSLENSAINIAGLSVSLGGSIEVENLQSVLGVRFPAWTEITGTILMTGEETGEFNFIERGTYLNVLWINNHNITGTGGGTIGTYAFGSGRDLGLASLLASGYAVRDGQSSQFLKADGSVDSTAYLSTAGGNINGTLAMVSGSKIQFYTPSSAFAGTLGADSNKNLFWYNNGAYNTLYHSGNFNPADYLPLSGGTIDGNLIINGNITITRNSSPLYLNVTSETIASALYFFRNLVNYGGLGMSGKNTPCFLDTNNTPYTLIHSGNYSDYALPLSGGVMNEGATIHWVANNTEDYTAFNSGFRLLQYNSTKGQYRGGIHVGSYYGWQMTRTNQVNVLQFRDYDRDNAQWSDWKTIAFTDSNVASADNAALLGGLGKTDFYRGNMETIPSVGNLAVLDAGCYWVYENLGETYPVPSTYSSLVAFGKSYYSPQMCVRHDASRAWLRGIYGEGKASDWHELAFTDSTVAAANKLVTSAGADAVLVDNNKHIYTSGYLYSDRSGDSVTVLDYGPNGMLLLGYGIAGAGLETHIYGNVVKLRGGTSRTIGFVLNESGNVTIGGSDLARSRKLFIDGSASFVIGTQNNITASDELDLTKTFTITAQSTESNYGLHAWINTSGCVNLQSSYAGLSANKSLYSIALNPLGGNVLIGTTTDYGAKLGVGGDVVIPNNFSYKILDTAGTARRVIQLNSGNGLLIGQHTAANGYSTNLYGHAISLVCGTANKLTMLLNSSGNVTIGGSDLAGTSTKLFVDGWITTKYGYRTYDSGDYGIWNGGQYSGSLTSTDIAYHAAKHVFAIGKVLIGTVTDNGAKLQVAGNFTCSEETRSNIFFFTTNGEDKGWFGSPNNSDASDFVASVYDGNIRFYTNNSERMRINSTGAVTMASTLSVSGVLTTTSDVRASGDVMAGGFLQAYSGVKIADTLLNSDGGVLSINASIDPETTLTHNLGNPTKLWKGIYSEYVETSNLLVYGTDGITCEGDIFATGNIEAQANLEALTATIGTVSISGNEILTKKSSGLWGMKFALENDYVVGQIAAYDDGDTQQYIYIGKSAITPWMSINATRAQFDVTTRTKDVIPSANTTYNLGSTTNQWLNIYGRTVSVTDVDAQRITVDDSILPMEDGTVLLGSSDYKFGEVWSRGVIAEAIDTDTLYVYHDIYNEGDMTNEGDIFCDGMIVTSELQVGRATISTINGTITADKPIEGEWYNIKTSRASDPTHINNVTVPFFTIIENYNSRLADSSKYRICLLTFRKKKGQSKRWRIPMLTPRWNPDDGTILDSKVVHSMPWNNTWWPATGTETRWFNATDDTLQTCGMSLRLNAEDRFSTAGSKKMRLGVAIFKKTGVGTWGWQRVSNIAEVILFANKNREIFTRVIE